MTEVIKIKKKIIENNNLKELMEEEAIKRGAELLKQGEIVAFPTETVYGLGADATNAAAVKKIFTAKGRPQDNPLIIHIAERNQLKTLSDREIANDVLNLISKFWPGPLTVVISKNKKIPAVTTAGLDTVAVRMPSHPVALALLKLSSLPVAAPSANSSGYPSPTRAEHVYEDLKGKVPLIIDGGQCSVGVESTVITVKNNKIEVLRPGGISPERLAEVPGYSVYFIDGKYKNSSPPSPGMKYRHYSPRTPLILVDRKQLDKIDDLLKDYTNPVFLITEETKKTGIISSSKNIIELGSRKNLKQIAYKLFDLLREIDKSDYDLIIAEKLPENGLGKAIMNRLHRASIKKHIN